MIIMIYIYKIYFLINTLYKNILLTLLIKKKKILQLYTKLPVTILKIKQKNINIEILF